MGQYDHTDYLRAVNALDLVDWLADQNEDKVLLARLVERARSTMSRLEALLDGGEPVNPVRRPPSVDGPFVDPDEDPVPTGEVLG